MHQIILRNTKNFVACETLIGIMMGHLEFSFVPFGRDTKEESSLDKLLDVFHIKNLLPYFAGINNIASDITNAEGYLYQNIVCRDFNPLSANFTKWSNTLKQFVCKLPTNCLSVFDHFVGLALKGLSRAMS